MIWIGLTGGIGSGKSEVAQGLRSRSYAVIDADKVARDVLVIDEGLLEKIRQTFGPSVFTTEGQLDRKALGEIVFSQKSSREMLESIIHPAIRSQVEKQKQELEKSGVKLAIYDVPLLFEKKMEGQFDKIVVVSATLQDRMRWLKKRDNIGSEIITKRIQAQLPLEDKLPRADFVVHNTKDLTHLEAEINRLDSYLQAQT